MTDRDALFRAVLANPADDLPRLVLADYLDDHGDADRAAYVRASVALARLVDAGDFDGDSYPAVVSAVASAPSEALWGWAVADGLLVPPEPATPTLSRDTAGAVDRVRHVGADLAFGYVRGLVGAARCRLATWEAFGRGWAVAAPLGRVEWTDRRPYQHRPREWEWRLPEADLGGPSNVLPPGVFARLPGHQAYVAVYRTRGEAEDAMSAACLGTTRPQNLFDG